MNKNLLNRHEEKGNISNQEKILQDIYHALGDQGGIDLEVKNGHVKVSGVVDNHSDLERVINTILEIDGVSEVFNDLRVKPESLH